MWWDMEVKRGKWMMGRVGVVVGIIQIRENPLEGCEGR